MNLSLNKMFFKKKPIDAEKLVYLEHEVETLKLKFKFLQDKFEDLEIKALESRKIYHKKLKQEFGEEEKKESENNIKQSVLLGPNGTPV